MNCLSSSEELSPNELKILAIKRSRNKALPLPSSHSLVGLVVCSFIPQTGSLRDPIPTDPCQEDTAGPPLPRPQRTIGAVAAIHTGDLAVHTRSARLAGSWAASNALVVDEGLLFAVHSLGQKKTLV